MKPEVRTEIIESLSMDMMCPTDRTWMLGVDIPEFCDWTNGMNCGPEKVRSCWDKWIALHEGE